MGYSNKAVVRKDLGECLKFGQHWSAGIHYVVIVIFTNLLSNRLVNIVKVFRACEINDILVFRRIYLQSLQIELNRKLVNYRIFTEVPKACGLHEPQLMLLHPYLRYLYESFEHSQFQSFYWRSLLPILQVLIYSSSITVC
jgi:hypothetical protein